MTRLSKSTKARELAAPVFRLALTSAVIGLAANIVASLWGANAGILASAVGGLLYAYFCLRSLRGSSLPRILAVLWISAAVGSLIATGAESAFARPGFHRCDHGKHVAPTARLHCIELRERGIAR